MHYGDETASSDSTVRKNLNRACKGKALPSFSTDEESDNTLPYLPDVNNVVCSDIHDSKYESNDLIPLVELKDKLNQSKGCRSSLHRSCKNKKTGQLSVKEYKLKVPKG